MGETSVPNNSPAYQEDFCFSFPCITLISVIGCFLSYKTTCLNDIDSRNRNAPSGSQGKFREMFPFEMFSFQRSGQLTVLDLIHVVDLMFLLHSSGFTEVGLPATLFQTLQLIGYIPYIAFTQPSACSCSVSGAIHSWRVCLCLLCVCVCNWLPKLLFIVYGDHGIPCGYT